MERGQISEKPRFDVWIRYSENDAMTPILGNMMQNLVPATIKSLAVSVVANDDIVRLTSSHFVELKE